MKKVFKLLLIITIIFLLIIFLKTQQYSVNDIFKVTRVKLEDEYGYSYKLENPKHSGNIVYLYDSVNNLGDYIIYKIVAQNKSFKSYTIEKEPFMSEPNKYIQYDTNLESNKKIINPGDKITIYLRIKYKNSPDNYSSWGILKKTSKIDIKFNNYNPLSDNQQSKKIVIILIAILLIGIIITLLFLNRRSKITLIILTLIFPFQINAVDSNQVITIISTVEMRNPALLC